MKSYFYWTRELEEGEVVLMPEGCQVQVLTEDGAPYNLIPGEEITAPQYQGPWDPELEGTPVPPYDSNLFCHHFTRVGDTPTIFLASKLITVGEEHRREMVHAAFKPSSVVTGRMSSSKPSFSVEAGRRAAKKLSFLPVHDEVMFDDASVRSFLDSGGNMAEFLEGLRAQWVETADACHKALVKARKEIQSQNEDTTEIEALWNSLAEKDT